MSYSFEDTEALLASLSGSSGTPTLSPSEFSPQQAMSPTQNMFGGDDMAWNGESNAELGDGAAIMTNTTSEYNSDDFTGMNVDFAGASGKTGEAKLDEYISSLENSPADVLSEIIPELGPADDGVNPGLLTSPTATVKKEPSTSPGSSSESSKEHELRLHGKPGSKVTKPKKDRSSHNIIEKKYRTNINAKITALRDAVPSLRMAAGDTDMTINDLDGLSPASKVNKASVLTKATEYIKHLEKKNAQLMAENQHLRQIAAGNMSPQQQQMMMAPQQQQQQPPPQQQPLYSHQPAPPQSMAQFQPALDFNGQPINVVSQQPTQPQYQMNVPGKVIMGGLATMVGQNLFNGDGYEYRGLSAFPIFATPYGQLFLSVLQYFTVAMAVMYIFLPHLFSTSGTEDMKMRRRNSSTVSANEWYELMKELVFISVGQQLKHEVSEFEVNALLNASLINGDSIPSFSSLLYSLFKLQTYQSNFEVEFGKLVLGKLLKEHSDMTAIFNLNTVVKKSIAKIANLKVPSHSLRYFFKELQNPSGEYTTESFTRLLNVICNLPLDLNCSRGLDYEGFKVILNDDRVCHDYKTLLVSFRAMELFREVMLKYIDLTSNVSVSELDSDELKERKKDLWDMLNLADNLAPERSICQIRIKLFKSILNEKYLDSTLQLIQEEAQPSSSETLVDIVRETETKSASSSQETLSVDVDEQEHEIFTSDEEAGDSDVEQEHSEEEEDIPASRSSTHESLESSQSSVGVVDDRFKTLVTKDLFNALASASILKYARSHKHKEAKQLLKYLALSKTDISLLSFICLFKLAQKYPREWCADDSLEGEALEQVVGTLRQWVGDSSNRSFDDAKDVSIQLKREISDKLVEVSKSFNEVEA